MSTSSDIKLQIPSRLYEEMLAQAVAELPNECCGLLAGRDGRVTHRRPLTNTLASPMRYEADPIELLKAEKDWRSQGIELLAIYHSHPTSDPIPSLTDLDLNFCGSAIIHLIVSLKGGARTVQAWHLEEATYRPAAWCVVPEDGSSV